MAQFTIAPDVHGSTLHYTLNAWLTIMQRAPRTRAALLYNSTTKGFALLNLEDPTSIADTAALPHLHIITELTRHDQALTAHDIDNPYTIAALQDHIQFMKPPPRPIPLEILLLTALSAAFKSAVEHIEAMTDEQTVKDGTMPLKGTLRKVLNYMAIQFTEHQYEFLHIAYNMSNHEYELLTPADKQHMEQLGKWGDRRLLLSCTIHELKKLLTSDQIRLELPDAKANEQKAGENRKLDSRLDTTALPGPDATPGGRSDHDGAISGPQSDPMEPSPGQ